VTNSYFGGTDSDHECSISGQEWWRSSKWTSGINTSFYLIPCWGCVQKNIAAHPNINFFHGYNHASIISITLSSN